MSKQVSFTLPEGCEDWKFEKKEFPGTLPPHIAAKFPKDMLSTIAAEGYYGKTKMQEDEVAEAFYHLKPSHKNVIPFLDTEAINMKPFFDASRELALRRIQKELAEEEVKISEHRLEIADKLYYIERLQTADTIGTSTELEKQRRSLDIQITYCEIESEKLILKKLELRKAELQDKWQEIQHWTES